MPRINKEIIRERQTLSLEERINISKNVVDLSWNGFSRDLVDTPLKYKTNAHVNRVLFWLASKEDDYIRESTKGGVLYSLIGQLCNTTNLSSWEESIKARFNNDFANDLSLLYIKLVPDNMYRKLSLNMIVQDLVEKKTLTINTEIEK